MANILDYLDWRGDLTLAQDPFNEVDNLILAELSFVDFGGIVPGPGEGRAVPLWKAAEAYFAKTEGRPIDMGVLVPNQIPELLRRTAASPRFRDMKLNGFVDHLDTVKAEQFAALAAECGDGTVYLSFRGTDDTLAGWKEDFYLSCMREVPAQKMAVAYTEAMAHQYPRIKLRLGGHSKGGNLAMYAAAMVPESVQERIGNIYNNDGPGFQEKILQTEGYRRIKPRIKTILSQNAMVGTLLWNDCDYTVVKSTAALLGAHDGFTWETTPTSFVRCENLSPSARAFDRAMEEVLVGMSMAERQEFIEEFFGTLTATGAVTLSDLSARMLRETLRFARAVHQEPSLHKMVNETLEAMAKGYAAERNWSLSRLKLPANPLRRKSAQKEKEE